jgi:hypothetical protein
MTLAETLARVKPGDRVRAVYSFAYGHASSPYEVVSTVFDFSGSLWGGPCLLRDSQLRPHNDLTALEILEPALPPEPPVGSVAVAENVGLCAFKRLRSMHDDLPYWHELAVGPYPSKPVPWSDIANLPGLVVVEPS